MNKQMPEENRRAVVVEPAEYFWGIQVQGGNAADDMLAASAVWNNSETIDIPLFCTVIYPKIGAGAYFISM